MLEIKTFGQRHSLSNIDSKENNGIFYLRDESEPLHNDGITSPKRQI